MFKIDHMSASWLVQCIEILGESFAAHNLTSLVIQKKSNPWCSGLLWRSHYWELRQIKSQGPCGRGGFKNSILKLKVKQNKIIFVILSKNEAKESWKPLIKLYVSNQFGPLNIEGRYRKLLWEREREATPYASQSGHRTTLTCTWLAKIMYIYTC